MGISIKYGKEIYHGVGLITKLHDWTQYPIYMHQSALGWVFILWWNLHPESTDAGNRKKKTIFSFFLIKFIITKIYIFFNKQVNFTLNCTSLNTTKELKTVITSSGTKTLLQSLLFLPNSPSMLITCFHWIPCDFASAPTPLPTQNKISISIIQLSAKLH